MIITAPSSTTPLAFTKATHAASQAAAASAAGFGSVSMADIKAIEAQVMLNLLSLGALEQAGEANTTKPDAGKPDLRPADLPRLMQAAEQKAESGAPRLTAQAVLLLYAMELRETFNLENTRSLASQLELMKGRLAARAATAAELSEAIRLAQALADAAMGDVGLAEGELAAAMEALKKANAEVARLEQALANAPEEDKDAIRTQLEAAKAHATTAQGNVNAAHGKLNEALATLNGALADLEAFKAAADQLDPNRSVSARGDEKALTNGSFLALLLASLQEIIDKANINKLREDTEFVREALKLREAENMRRSEEYHRELEKAEQAQKKMGCIGKIVGWVITVVAVVAAPFTGGASMALAAVGLALAVLEEVGVDIMGKIMEPIMKLIMALVKEVGGVIGNVLKGLGVPAEVVDKIKDALAVIAVAAVVVALVFVSKKAAGTLAVQNIMKAVTKAVTDAVSRALPAMIKSGAHAIKSTVDDVSASIAKTASKAVGASTENMAKRMGYVTTASHGMQLANQSSQVIGQGFVNEMLVKAEKLKADLQNGLMDSEIFRELMQKLLDTYVQATNLVQEIFKVTSDVQANAHATAQFITQRVGKA